MIEFTIFNQAQGKLGITTFVLQRFHEKMVRRARVNKSGNGNMIDEDYFAAQFFSLNRGIINFDKLQLPEIRAQNRVRRLTGQTERNYVHACPWVR